MDVWLWIRKMKEKTMTGRDDHAPVRSRSWTRRCASEFLQGAKRHSALSPEAEGSLLMADARYGRSGEKLAD